MRTFPVFLFFAVFVAGSVAASLCPSLGCARLPSNVDFGPTANLQRLYVDVGSCIVITNCSSDSDSKNTSDLECGTPSCVPSSYEMESFSNRSGPFLVTTIGSCQMSCNSFSSCRRWPKPMTVLPNSGYQQVVDVGSCSGQCSGTQRDCVPTVNYTVAVNGPNGALLVNQIKECGCSDSRCYRQDYYESHLELKTNGNNGSLDIAQKLINVGRCVGNCAGIVLGSLCYPSPDLCWLHVAPQRATCAPTASTTSVFTGLDGNEVSVAAVVECGCITG